MSPNGASDHRHGAHRHEARAGRLDGDPLCFAAQRRLVSTPGATDAGGSRQRQRTDLAPKHVSRRPSVNDPGQRRPLLLVARSPVVVSSLRALHLPLAPHRWPRDARRSERPRPDWSRGAEALPPRLRRLHRRAIVSDSSPCLGLQTRDIRPMGLRRYAHRSRRTYGTSPTNVGAVA
jgi:hypothetical protein